MSNQTKTKIGGEIVSNAKYGKMHHRSLFMSTGARTCTLDDGTVLDLSYTLNGQPIVQNTATRKQYVLGWQAVVNLAIDEGILDNSDPVYVDEKREFPL